jgi:DNA polymerase-3 subunit delta
MWEMARKDSTEKSEPRGAGAAGLDASRRVVVLFGPEDFLRTQYTAQLRAALEAAHGQVDVLQIDGTTAQVADVLDECRSFGLMATHKLVMVDQADMFVKEGTRAVIERYAEKPSENATLLLRSEKWRAGNLDGIIESHGGALVRCEAPMIKDERGKDIGPDFDKIQRWAMARAAKRHAANLDKDAAELLVMRIGASLGRIDTELEKLAVAAGAAAGRTPGRDASGELPTDAGKLPTIDAALVSRFVGMSREEEVWDIKQKLLTGSAEEILGNVRDLIEVSRHPPTLITYAMTDLAKGLHGASRALRAGANPFQVAGKLKIWGPGRDAILHVAKAIRPEQAYALFRECLDADRRQKSGLGDGERTVERLALRFAALSPD